MSKKIFDQPTFIISLDTELLWGYIAQPPTLRRAISLMKNDDKKVRGCIEILLNLFEKHNIPATWAIVGHLFLDHCEKEDGIPHKDMPRFKDDWYSSDLLVQTFNKTHYTMERTLLRRFYRIGLNMKSATILSPTSSFQNAAERL